MESASSRNRINPSKDSFNQVLRAIKDKSCPICLRHVDIRRPAVVAACMHLYCRRCLLRWSTYKRNCPLCNADFDSYFSNIRTSSRAFQKFLLPPLEPPPAPRCGSVPRGERRPLLAHRLIRRTRDELNSANQRSRPLPRQRSFGQLGAAPSDGVPERILQWRASIYKRQLLAIPIPNRGYPQQKFVLSTNNKERMLQRIEPWIERELKALLEDPNPSVIVHVATSLYISSIEAKPKGFSVDGDTEHNFLAPLRRFLHEWTDMFWHELRCFAENSLTMDTYDAVVEYKHSN